MTPAVLAVHAATGAFSGVRRLCRVRALLAALLAAAVAAPLATVTGLRFADAAPDYGRAIEWYAAYQPQKTCSPTAKAGTSMLAAHLQRAYSGTGSLGIVRACRVGGTSEHKEGRAFDWRVNYYDSGQRAQAQKFLTSILATDRYGNKHALARRMGIMYVIWNKRIWSAYNPGSWRTYTGASPHRDHVHISLSWAGARGLTSFYSGKVAPPVDPPKPPPAPAPKPAPSPEPSPKPTVAPRPPAPSVPVLNQTRRPVVKLRVSGTGAPLRTKFSLQAGRAYRFVAVGTYRYGGGSLLADASCNWHPYDDAGWSPRSTWEPQAMGHLDLVVGGSSAWRPRDGSSTGCDRNHAYVWDYRPARTGPVNLQVRDDYAGDNRGALRVFVLRRGADPLSVTMPALPAPAALPAAPVRRPLNGPSALDETLTVPAARRAGALTSATLEAGRAYRVDVTGTFDYGEGAADAECSRAGQAHTWRRQRSVQPLHPEQDHLDLLLDGTDVSLYPARDAQPCDADDHAYRFVYRPKETGQARFSIWDPHHTDNMGGLTVRVTLLDEAPRPRFSDDPGDTAPIGDETVSLDAATGKAWTSGTLRRGRTYTVTVTGTWSTGYGEADAECATYRGADDWQREAWAHPNRPYDDLFDVLFDGRDPAMRAADTRHTSGCSPTHTYVATLVPEQTRRLEFALWDVATRDNSGGLTIRITERRR